MTEMCFRKAEPMVRRAGELTQRGQNSNSLTYPFLGGWPKKLFPLWGTSVKVFLNAEDTNDQFKVRDLGGSHEVQGQEVQLCLMIDGNQALGCCEAPTQLCSP